MISLLITVVLTYAAAVTYLYFNQRNIMFVPNRARPYPQSNKVQIVNVVTQDKLEIQSWYYPPADATKPVLMYFHGNGGNIGGRVDKIQDYLSHGYGILFGEYRGYGGNGGIPSEQGFYADARAYLYWLTVGMQIPLSHIVLYGESIGTGVAVKMATEFPARALVLEGAYDTMADVVAGHYPLIPVKLMLKDRFPSIDLIGQVHMPVLIVSADHDRIIPGALSEKLFKAASEPKKYVVLAGAEHNNMHEHGLSTVVMDFLNSIDFSAKNDKN